MWFCLIVLLFVPGLTVALLLKFGRLCPVLATPISLSLYLICLGILSNLGNASLVFNGYLVLSAGLLTVLVFCENAKKQLLMVLPQLLEFVPVLLVVVVYHIWAGPFIDHGADVFRHMVYINRAIEHLIDTGGKMLLGIAPGTNNLAIHNISAHIFYNFTYSRIEILNQVALAYSLLWTGSVYYFCRFIFNKIGINARELILVSYLAVLFYWSSFGINNFSFPRYYALAPVILNFSIYLGALVVILDQLGSRVTVKNCILLAVLVSTATYIHPQEVSLLVSFLIALSVLVVFYRLVGISETLDIGLTHRNTRMAVAVLIFTVAGTLVSITFLEKYRFDPIPLRNLGTLISSLVDWNILRPTHQFYTVLGLWGLYVIAFATLKLPKIGKSLILSTTLILPFITVFNPLYTEAFMRIAYPQVLWRLLFAMHLPIVAVYLLRVEVTEWKHKQTIKRILSIILVAPMIVLLFPFTTGPISNTMVKTASLVPTPTRNSFDHWLDLVDYLETLDKEEKILTDPSTGYMIRALTRHHHYGKKFFKIGYKEFNFENYSKHPLWKYKGWLLITNLRDGDINNRLKPPLHIFPNIMQTRGHYSETLLTELKNSPARYQLLWKNNEISVYRIGVSETFLNKILKLLLHDEK